MRDARVDDSKCAEEFCRALAVPGHSLCRRCLDGFAKSAVHIDFPDKRRRR